MTSANQLIKASFMAFIGRSYDGRCRPTLYVGPAVVIILWDTDVLYAGMKDLG